MSATKYQVFCRYLNDKVNRILTNQTTVEWVSAEEYNTLDELFYTKTYNSKTGKYTKTTTEYYNEYQEILKMLLEYNYAYEKDNITYYEFQNKILKVEDLNVRQLEIYTNGKRYEEILNLEKNKKMVKENCLIEPMDSCKPANGSNKEDINKLIKAKMERDLSNYEIIIEEALAYNSKFDMVFMYDGIAYNQCDIYDYNPGPSNQTEVYQNPYLYYDRMKRVKLDPWFLYSTHGSLTSAMIKAKELINILGIDGVKVGKVVPLDQYIEIV